MSKFIKTLTLKRGLVTNATADTIDLLSDTKSVAAERLIGNPTGSSAAVVEIPLGTGLAFSGGALVNTATPGPTGPAGADGRDAGIKYTYSTTTTAADPGSGYLRFNNATLSSATEMYISETDGDGNGIAATLATWDDSTSTVRGTLTLRAAGDPTTFVQFQITGTLTDNGTWDTFTVVYVSGSTAVVDATVFHLEFSRTGNKGDTGSVSSVTASRLLGRYSGTDGTPEEIQVEATAGLSIDSDGYLRAVRFPLTCHLRLYPNSTGHLLDGSNATTIYDLPARGSGNGGGGWIPLWDGTRWRRYAQNSTSFGVPSAAGVYDVFAYPSSGTVAYSTSQWTNNTTRGFALTDRDGVVVLNSDHTKRYRGTIWVPTTSGGCPWSATQRGIYNHENQVEMAVRQSLSNAHAYNSATVRYWNNDSANKVDFVWGGPMGARLAYHSRSISTCSVAGVALYAGWGINSTTALSSFGTHTSAATYYYPTVHIRRQIDWNTLGVSTCYVLQQGSATGNNTFDIFDGEILLMM